MKLKRPRSASTLSLLVGLACAVGALLFFAWLAEEVFEDDSIQIDEWMRAAIHQFASPALTSVMRAASFVGSSGFLIALGVCVVLAMMLAGWKRGALIFVVTMMGAILLEVVLKLVFHRARPLPLFETALPSTYSFPSGHALFSFCFYGVLTILLTARTRRVWIRVAAWSLTTVLVALIGVSRIYLGVHHASDVAAGFTAAFVWVSAVALGGRLLGSESSARSGAKLKGRTRHCFIVGLLIAISAVPFYAQGQSPALSITAPSTFDDGLTFEQVYELAARGNLQLDAIRRRRAVAEAGVLIAGQRPNPELITGYTRSEPRLNLSVAQPIEIGHQRARRLEVARGEVRLSELDLDAALRTLRRDLRIAYFNLSLDRDIRNLGRQSVAQTQKLADIAGARFEAGEIAQFEVLQANLSVARATNDLARLENTERVSLAGLNRLLNRAPDAPIELRESLFIPRAPVPVSGLIERALSQNVELRAAEQQITTERSRLRLARAERIPNLILEPGIESLDPSLPNNYGFKMQVTIPLPIFNRGRGEIARSNALAAQLTAERDAARQRISSEIGQASLRLEGARRQVEFYETKLLPDAERVRQLTEEAYRAGQTGILPVIDAQRSAREVRQEYLQALFDYQSALADLEEAAGVTLR